MPYHARPSRRDRGNSNSKSRKRQTVQKPSGVISPRVQKVGGERFAIVCVDPAKHRSEWIMADYFGNLLIEPKTLEHQSPFFKLAVELIRQAQEKHNIQDMIVVVERTGNYYLPPKRAFASAGFETRVVHPFATKQYQMPADPGNKTDETDLMLNTEPLLPDLGCASMSWNHLIENCSYVRGTAATLSRKRQLSPARFESTCTWQCPVMPICSVVCSNSQRR